jgi:hypothetical protein
MNVGHGWGIVWLLHTLEEGILPCKLEQINADPKGNWARLVQKKINQQIVNGSKC